MAGNVSQGRGCCSSRSRSRRRDRHRRCGIGSRRDRDRSVIGGVSLRGGIGRVEGVVLGAFFIVLIQNGMDLMQIGSYMQMVLLGVLLIVAVIVDQVRYRLLIGTN